MPCPKDSQREHMFRMVKDLKVVLGKGKGGGSKKSKRWERMQRRMRRIMVIKLQLCSKNINILEPTISKGLDGASCN
jgi:hypothetical protein